MTNYAAQAEKIAQASARAASYGAYQTNPLSEDDLRARDAIDYSAPETALSDRRLVKITRLRLLTDAGCPWYDVSYCYGELSDGTPVRVWLGDGQISKGGKFGLKGRLVELARNAGRNAKALGLLDDYSISVMR
jgi:hypothetical protein